MSRKLVRVPVPAAGLLVLALAPAGCGLDTGGILIGFDGAAGDADVLEGDWVLDAPDQDGSLPDQSELAEPPLPDLADAPDREDVSTCADMGVGYCSDGLECTDDVCIDTDYGPDCRFPVSEGFCNIDGACIAAHASNPAEDCLACRPTLSNTVWSPREDMEACVGGVCCGGECRLGGNCCTGTDCGGCSGPGADCRLLTVDVCLIEIGCYLAAEGTCGGRHACSTWHYDETLCSNCGCYWDSYGDCDNSGTNICQQQTTESGCSALAVCGCTWTSSGVNSCQGIYYPCSGIIDEATCWASSDCSWNPSGLCDPDTYACAT